MAIQIGTRYTNSLLSPLGKEETVEFFWDFERALFPHFPGLKASEKVKDTRYHWVFTPLSYGGHEIQIEFQTDFEKKSDLIEVHSVPGVGSTTLDGGWRFSTESDKTRVAFEFDIKGSLALPFFLKGVVAPAADKELNKLFTQYLSNVEKAIQS